MKSVPLQATLALAAAPFVSAQSAVSPDGATPPAQIPQTVTYDDMSQFMSATDAAALLQGLKQTAQHEIAPEGGMLQPPRTASGPAAPKGEHTGRTLSRYSVERMIEEPLYSSSASPTAEDDGSLTARIRGMKAAFSPVGFTVYPALGKAASGDASVHFQLGSVTVAGEPLPFSESAAITRHGDVVTLQRDSVRETYHVDLKSVEQTFVFDALPSLSGDLVLDIDVTTKMAVTATAESLQFAEGSLGGVTYGAAFVLDAAGRRQAIQRTWTGASIELTVPSAFLANATFPITVDPPVSSFTSTAGLPDDSNVDLCFTGASGLYWAVFEDYVNASLTDIYAMSFDEDGILGDFITVAAGSDAWTAPKIAYHAASDRCLVVASVLDNGSGSIQGRFIDCSVGLVGGPAFVISTIGALKVHPDIAGNRTNNLNDSHLLVAWSTVWNPGVTHQIQYRVITWTGNFVSAVTEVTDFAPNEVHNEPSLSASQGDSDVIGDWWTLVWTHDADNSGFGQILGRRVRGDGVPVVGADTITISPDSNCAHPRVTSRFNDQLLHIGDYPSLVVYEKLFSSPLGGLQRSLYARVMTRDAAEAESPISWQLEDFDLDLDQFEPDVACDGNCFYLIYAETFWGEPAGTDYDMYMLSGCITNQLDGAEIALAERHEILASSPSAERNGAVATVWDGEINSSSDDGLAIWEDQSVVNGGTLEGASLEIPTVNQSTVRAVGRQFCDNNPNSGGGQGGRQASWSWLQGNQSVSSSHFFRAKDLPLNTFGYAIIGTSFANINNPAGSLGRVCVPGGGRYVDQIQSSGGTGTLQTMISPMNAPSPTGFISMQVGETWGFQYWHRDTAPDGTSSSNFSTACRMQFTN